MKRRRLLLLSVPAALLLLVGIVLLAGGGDGGSTGEASKGPSAEELRAERIRKLVRQHESEDRAIDRLLDTTTYIASGGGTRREVALTFDDGPGPGTVKILDILRRTHTPATFFVVGTSVPDHEEILRRITREGHAIGNHTQEHPPMATLDPAGQGEQILRQENAVEDADGKQRNLFRPPYRSFNRETMNLLQEHEDLMVLWNVDTNDYENPGADYIVQTVLNEAKPGSIILMHDAGGNRDETIEALPEIIRGLKQKGLKPVTIPRMVRNDPPLNQGRYPEGL